MSAKALALAALCLLAVSSATARELVNPGRRLNQYVDFGEPITVVLALLYIIAVKYPLPCILHTRLHCNHSCDQLMTHPTLIHFLPACLPA